jgi:D-arabinose 1-dehydrogenase-like Zn-dependent alcohol dehydrogenase
MRGELEVMGSRYATRQEVIDALDLVARGELRSIVTEKVPLAQAEAIHQRLDRGLITGRAALMIA